MIKQITVVISHKHFNLILLSCIVLLAFLVRIVGIEYAPSRLTHDEMSIGYNAYSVVQTGRDEWGKFLPLNFQAFGDHKLPGYIYAVVPFVKVLGLSVLSLKLPSILAGTLTVLVIFKLVSLLSKNKELAFISSVIFAFSPWSIHLSRMAFESNLALLFATTGLYFLVRSLSFRALAEKFGKAKTLYKLSILAGIFFALPMYTYIAYRLIFVLFLLAGTLYSYVKKKHLRAWLVTSASCLIFLIPLIPNLIGQSGTARFSQVSVFSDPGVTSRFTEQRNFCFLVEPLLLPKICKVVFNKPLVIAETVTDNYLQFIFPTFSFVTGDVQLYLQTPGFASFFTLLSLFYLIGLWQAFAHPDKKYHHLLLLFFLAPIPAALVEIPQIVRGTMMLPLMSIFIGLGILFVKDKLLSLKLLKISKTTQSLVFYFGFIGFFSLATLIYLLNYFVVYNNKYAGDFYLLSPEVTQFVLDKESEYDTIYVTREFPDAHISFAFFGQFDPAWYQENVVRPKGDDFGFSHPTQLGKYQFGNSILHEYLCDVDKKTLFITRNHDLTGTWEFTDFSGVHTEVQLFDTQLMRESLRSVKALDKECPQTSG